MLWTNELCVGIEKIDADHKKITELFNHLVTLDLKNDRVKLIELLDIAIKLIQEHMEFEQNLLSFDTFSEFQKHVQHHEQIVGKIKSFHASLNKNDSDNYPVFSIQFIKHACFAHMLDEINKFKLRPLIPAG